MVHIYLVYTVNLSGSYTVQPFFMLLVLPTDRSSEMLGLLNSVYCLNNVVIDAFAIDEDFWLQICDLILVGDVVS